MPAPADTTTTKNERLSYDGSILDARAKCTDDENLMALYDLKESGTKPSAEGRWPATIFLSESLPLSPDKGSFYHPVSILGSASPPMTCEQIARPVRIDGIELHCAERGTGAPIIFIHGAIDDYRYWATFLNQPGYRTMAYSRRYNFPNPPSEYLSSYPALVDAEDLRRLSSALGIAGMHLVAISYGAYVALFFALKNPESVKSMVLCEPGGAAQSSPPPSFESCTSPLSRVDDPKARGESIWARLRA